MITINKSDDNKTINVSGEKHELMLFYCFWQSSLWPYWMQYSKLGEYNDSATKQHRHVIKLIDSEESIVLYNVDSQFNLAYQFAVDRCSMLGIDVNVDILV